MRAKRSAWLKLGAFGKIGLPQETRAVMNGEDFDRAVASPVENACLVPVE